MHVVHRLVAWTQSFPTPKKVDTVGQLCCKSPDLHLHESLPWWHHRLYTLPTRHWCHWHIVQRVHYRKEGKNALHSIQLVFLSTGAFSVPNITSAFATDMHVQRVQTHSPWCHQSHINIGTTLQMNTPDSICLFFLKLVLPLHQSCTSFHHRVAIHKGHTHNAQDASSRSSTSSSSSNNF